MTEKTFIKNTSGLDRSVQIVLHCRNILLAGSQCLSLNIMHIYHPCMAEGYILLKQRNARIISAPGRQCSSAIYSENFSLTLFYTTRCVYVWKTPTKQMVRIVLYYLLRDRGLSRFSHLAVSCRCYSNSEKKSHWGYYYVKLLENQDRVMILTHFTAEIAFSRTIIFI